MPLDIVTQRMAKAVAAAGRKAADVALIAVSKNRSAQELMPLLEAGHRLFGENRVQEAAEKWPALKERFPDVHLHLIGQLQSNKARDAVALFDCIETVDRESLALALGREMQKQNRHIPCLIQVNTGAEPQKGGIAPDALPAFLDFCRKDAGLNVRGLMCIPPADALPDPHFALLHKLSRQFFAETPPQLSMGMSNDFEAAIRYGATHIRVGTALF